MCKYRIVFTPKYRRKVIYNKLRKNLSDTPCLSAMIVCGALCNIDNAMTNSDTIGVSRIFLSLRKIVGLFAEHTKFRI